MFLCYSDSSDKNYWKTFYLDKFLLLRISSWLHKLDIYVAKAYIIVT